VTSLRYLTFSANIYSSVDAHVIAIVSVDSNFIEEILFIVKCKSNHDTLM